MKTTYQKNTKNIIIYILILLLITSCKKYSEGPALSLRTKKERLTNHWKAEKILVNNVDKTSDFSVVKIHFEKDGKYYEHSVSNQQSYTQSGLWNFTYGKEHVFISYDSGTGNDFTIIRLKEKELWFIDDGDPDNIIEVHLIPE